MSQSRRAMVECIFGWGKQHGTMRKTKHRGIARVAADFLLNLIAYNPDPHSQTACRLATPRQVHPTPGSKITSNSTAAAPTTTGENTKTLHFKVFSANC